MAKNRKFLGYAILLNVLGIIFMFLYSGLQNDQINIIQAFITADGGGWNAQMTQMPMMVGNFLCIILTFLYGTLFIKFGVKKPLIVVMIITAIATMGIVAANGLDCNGGASSGNYPLFFISLLIVRCGCMILQMAGFMLGSVSGKCLSDEKSFNVSVTEDAGEWVVTLVPVKKSMLQMWAKLVLHFDPARNTVSGIEMHEQSGDLTVISFTDVKLNGDLDPGLFHLK